METAGVADRNSKTISTACCGSDNSVARRWSGQVKCATNYHICYGSSEFVHHFTIASSFTSQQANLLTNEKAAFPALTNEEAAIPRPPGPIIMSYHHRLAEG